LVRDYVQVAMLGAQSEGLVKHVVPTPQMNDLHINPRDIESRRPMEWRGQSSKKEKW
jgi:hypothetical protein